jgi:hypothetical protein
MMSMLLLIVMLCGVDRTRGSKLAPSSADFLHGLRFSPEDGDNVFLQNVRLSPNYMPLQSRRLYF